MMSKTLALELAGDDIRVNCICPGATRTAMISEITIKNIPKQIPLRRIGEPEDVAEMAFFLASNRARQITGGVFVVDGGIPQDGRGLLDQRPPAARNAASSIFEKDPIKPKLKEAGYVDTNAQGRV